MDPKSQQYLNQYLQSLPENVAKKYTSFSADYYCADEHNANICANLVLRGEKTATCSLAYWYTHKDELMPELGHLQVVTDWSGNPVCIIEITSVELCPFNQVTAAFAADEGEGDKSLGHWRKAHWNFFSQECQELGIELKDDIELVLERFKVVCK